MNKRFIIALSLLLLLSTYNIQNNFTMNSKFSVEEIIVENNSIIKKKEVKEKLSFLLETNLFFLRTNEIESKLGEIDLIESFELKKIYPNKIILKIFEKKPVAILQNKQDKKYYTDNGDIINFFQYDEFENLPIVFANKENFKFFLKDLTTLNFPLDELKKLYFFESKRWDLLTKKNKTIKLPISEYHDSLKNFLDIRNKASFEKYKIFDYRINNQLILK
mgnify:FL=1